MYQIQFIPQAVDDLRRINPVWQRRIKQKIELLASNPASLKNNIKKLTGKYSGLARLRIGSYRVIFQVKKDELIILIVKISNRQNLY